MKNQGCLLMAEGGRGLDINRQSLLRNPKVFCRRSPTCLQAASFSTCLVRTSCPVEFWCGGQFSVYHGKSLLIFPFDF